MDKEKDNKIQQENLKVLFQASCKVMNGEFKTFDEVQKWIWNNENYTPSNYDLSYGIPHLNNLKFYFL